MVCEFSSCAMFQILVTPTVHIDIQNETWQARLLLPGLLYTGVGHICPQCQENTKVGFPTIGQGKMR
jgi:hypothetical protein